MVAIGWPAYIHSSTFDATLPVTETLGLNVTAVIDGGGVFGRKWMLNIPLLQEKISGVSTKK